ncbi:hypothetical protein RRG08_054403 [Elysia crispata]|uniref:Uncharacterized protein n=1 Tax=Elysia crispata TaxID=231223 RepID=A0AAE1E9X8_9GAST|nr:hypothetical protein RRG08_054403 [Elysia crispata]
MVTSTTPLSSAEPQCSRMPKVLQHLEEELENVTVSQARQEIGHQKTEGFLVQFAVLTRRVNCTSDGYHARHRHGGRDVLDAALV